MNLFHCQSYDCPKVRCFKRFLSMWAIKSSQAASTSPLLSSLQLMKEMLEEHLPRFTIEEKNLLLQGDKLVRMS